MDIDKPPARNGLSVPPSDNINISIPAPLATGDEAGAGGQDEVHAGQSSSGRPSRACRLPRRFLDMIPNLTRTSVRGVAEEEVPQVSTSTGDEALPPAPEDPPASPEIPIQPHPPLPRRKAIRTEEDEYGLYRKYNRLTVPVGEAASTEHEDEDHLATPNPETGPQTIYYPYPNRSSYLLGKWFWRGSQQKSLIDFDNLLNVLRDPTFDATELDDVDFHRLNRILADNSLGGIYDERNGWKERSVWIDVPLGKSAVGAPSSRFRITGIRHRSLISVVESVFSSKEESKDFCYEPYELRYKSPVSGKDSMVYGEVYGSKAFREAHEAVQDLPREEGDNLPRAVAACMFWSDGMAATNFGTTKIWPVYLQFGNQSKYVRGKFGNGACHHTAFLPSVSSFHSYNAIDLSLY